MGSLSDLMNLPQQPQQPQPFSGVVNYQGQPIPVTNGIAYFNGKRFMVGTNGNVTDTNGGNIGSVMNGNFIPATR